MDFDLAVELKGRFGWNSFRVGQFEAIQSLLYGRNVLAVMPTGAGKSLIYQFTATHVQGVTLVISPLISLMQNQIASLDALGISATCINSSMDTSEQRRRLAQVVKGVYRLLYVAPERLRSLAFQETLSQARVGLVAVDEAHCISQWGYDFRPDYLWISAIRKMLGEPLTVAVTATATAVVQQEIVDALHISGCSRIVTGFNRPNLTWEVQRAANEEEKLRILQRSLVECPNGATLVYVGTRREAVEVADFICEVVGLDAKPYHAGMEQATRSLVQNRFLAGKLNVIVATNAFAMGIDRSDVRQVIHYDITSTLESYYQEAGRAGRDGKPARALLLYQPEDRSLQEWFIESSTLGLNEMKMLHDTLVKMGEDCGVCASKGVKFRTTTEELSARTSLGDVKIRTGLAQLEMAGSAMHLGDDGTDVLISVRAWQEADCVAVVRGNEVRRRRRIADLAKMVGYAEAKFCRRKILLCHFGDESFEEAPDCCDNCASSVPLAKPELNISAMALIILEAVSAIKWELGKIKLAGLLTGSTTQSMLQVGYNHLHHFGVFKGMRRDAVNALIGQMVSMNYLAQTKGFRPVLRLTQEGKAALASGRSIPTESVQPERSTDKCDAVTAFLTNVHPVPLEGPWDAGWALGFYSHCNGGNWNHSTVGSLAYRLKYQQDASALAPLVSLWANVVKGEKNMSRVDLVVPVPPSSLQGQKITLILGSELGNVLGIECRQALERARAGSPQKELHTNVQKRRNVSGAFAAVSDVAGRRVLLIDDIYDSGATLVEASAVLSDAGARSVCVLTLTRTIHYDG